MKINAITVLTIAALHHDVTSSSRIEPNLFQSMPSRLRLNYLRIPSLISRNSSPFNAFCSSPLCFQNHATARKRNVRFTGNTRTFAAKQNWDNSSNNEFQVGSTQSNEPKTKGGAKARLARATASLIAKRKKEESLNHNDNPSKLSFPTASASKMQRSSTYVDAKLLQR